MLDLARGLYCLLYELDHRNWRLAKQVESEVAPRGQARYICLGTSGGNDYPKLAGTGAQTIVSEVDHLGQRQDVRLGGYGGCLHSFPDLPFRPRSDVAELVQAVRRGEVQCETEGDHGDEAEDP